MSPVSYEKHTVTVEFDAGLVFYEMTCTAPANAMCHAVFDCTCERYSNLEDVNGVPTHQVQRYFDGEPVVTHVGRYAPEYCVIQDWFQNSDYYSISGKVTFTVQPKWENNEFSYEIIDTEGSSK